MCVDRLSSWMGRIVSRICRDPLGMHAKGEASGLEDAGTAIRT
jgi:hypothetical protein